MSLPSPSGLERGKKVMLKGLSTRALNGTMGVVVSSSSNERGRWKVRIGAAKTVLVKAENIKVETNFFDVVFYALHRDIPVALPPLLPHEVVTIDGDLPFNEDDLKACIANVYLMVWDHAKRVAENPEYAEKGRRFVAAIEERMLQSKVSSGPINADADNLLAKIAEAGHDAAQRGRTVVFHLVGLSLYVAQERICIQ